jgi:hypothetical protein
MESKDFTMKNFMPGFREWESAGNSYGVTQPEEKKVDEYSSGIKTYRISDYPRSGEISQADLDRIYQERGYKNYAEFIQGRDQSKLSQIKGKQKPDSTTGISQ